MNHPRSPVLILEKVIAGAPYRIAPEREVELGSWVDTVEAEIEIADGPGFKFVVDTDDRVIKTNVSTLEYLWASAHAHLVLYNEYGLAQQRGQAQFDTGGNDRSRSALDLLHWAIDNMHGSGRDAWPSELTAPIEEPSHGSDEHLANEMFLCAVAWIVHHELAHVRLEHSTVLTSHCIEEERSADLEATKFILELCNNLGQRRKRTLGIAMALLAIQAVEEKPSPGQLQTHPHAFERIDYCLNESRLGEHDEIFAFCLCIMQIQLASMGRSITHDGNSFRSILDAYMIEFSRL